MPRALPPLSALLLAVASAGAQQNDNIGHRHHLHRHNERHPTAPADAARFTTSRSGAVLPLPSELDAFTFVVFGDRTGGPADGVRVLAEAVHDVNLLEPDLVMTVGDLVQGYNETPKWLEQMREFKEIMGQLICPWFPVAGNHDVYWRGAGERPAGEHEQSYELHFGPLWYAFEHKNCWFIALYSDEGNPETGEKNFRKPEAQRMSPAQFDWLAATLERARAADHVFLFLHHPRWLGGGYGDDWERVHELLKSAGNVTAVFAGHIHKMRYDGPRDGIEYVTLATVGGGQSELAPRAGYLHHYNVITVRRQQVAMASIPVGQAMDVREITGALMEQCGRLARSRPELAGSVALAADGSADAVVLVSYRNAADRPIDITLEPASADSRWSFAPDHDHATLAPGQAYEREFRVTRLPGVDDAFRPAGLRLALDYLAPGARYPIPASHSDLPLDLSRLAPAQPAGERVLSVTGAAGYVEVPSAALGLAAGAGQPLTLECWFRARSYGDRTGLVTKTEGSDYGIFVNKGRPTFSVHIDGSYLSVRPQDVQLETDRWYHIAGVYDGGEARLYVDGVQLGSARREGPRKTNDLPLLIGADVNGSAAGMSFFDGEIDAVRLSDSARYSGERFTPVRRPESDPHALLLLNMDGRIGPWVWDASPRRVPARIVEPATLHDLN